MAIPKSRIAVLIDINSSMQHEWSHKTIENIKEAISFQISRGAITNYKLIKLGREPLLARVKWSYCFVDTAISVEKQLNNIGRPLQPLRFDGWEMFAKEFDEAVKQCKTTPCFDKDQRVSDFTKINNLVDILNLVSFSELSATPNEESKSSTSSLSVDMDMKLLSNHNMEKFIFVFTTVPKSISSLIHLAYGLTKFKNEKEDVRICVVDIESNTSIIEHNDHTPCFWSDLHKGSIQFSLKILCLQKIMMIHKLEILRYPWKYEESLMLPFGYGMGMRRLQRWTNIPRRQIPEQDLQYCLPLRRCCSDEQ